MSKGPGKLQREIAALIAAEPDGAWAYEDLAALIYGAAGWTRAQKSAIGRALAAMKLPGTWTIGDSDRRRWLYDECNLASFRKTRRGHHESHFQPGGSS